MDYAWGPNDGCAEFMTEPDEMPCGRPATRTLTTYFYDTHQGKRGSITEHLCTDHAAMHAIIDGGSSTVEAVHVRPLAGAR